MSHAQVLNVLYLRATSLGRVSLGRVRSLHSHGKWRNWPYQEAVSRPRNCVQSLQGKLLNGKSKASVGKGKLDSSYLMIALNCLAEGYGEEGSRLTISVLSDLEEISHSFRSLRQIRFLLTPIQQNIFCLKCCLNVLNYPFIYSVRIEQLLRAKYCDRSWGISEDMSRALWSLTLWLEKQRSFF